MKIRAFPGVFLLLLVIGAMLASTRRPPAREHGRAWHLGEVTYDQGANGSSASLERPEGSRAKVAAEYGKLPLSFEANRGQTDPHVNFISRGSGYTLYLTSTEAVLTLRQNLGSAQPTAGRKNPQISSKRRVIGETQEAELGETKGHVPSALRMKLVGANRSADIEGLEPLPGKSNYFIGNDPTKWHTDIPTYAKVRYWDIYPGVDLVYYGHQQLLEYDFIVAAGANPKTIRLAIAGVEKLESDTDGDLVLGTNEGEVRLHKPIVYQEVGGIRKEIAGRFVVRGKRQIGFGVAAYDTERPLIIDPVLSYSTYLGGSADDVGQAIAVDSAGNAYVTGRTSSSNFPTASPLQPTCASCSSGRENAFVTKLNATGSALLYSTYLGGSGSDFGNGIAVDSTGNAYVTGGTSSSNFPTIAAFQATCASCGSGQENAFVTKLNATGSALLYSTYLGGTGGDFGSGIAVDTVGNAYVTGGASSSNFPTKNPLQLNLGGGQDAFVTKLDPIGSALVYSTFLGGSASDGGSGIAVDAGGNAYVTGSTTSSNFPTKNALQPTPGGSDDAFVTKLDPTGSALVYSTYLGGSGSDGGSGIAVDSGENAYVTGGTASFDFPTANPFQATCGGCRPAQPNAFVSKLNAGGSALVYSTFLGGKGNGTDGDVGNAIAVDTSNSVYVTGMTSSPNFPLTSPIQTTFVPQTCSFNYYGVPYTLPCGNTAFVTKLNPAGSPLVYSTYLGASGGNFEEGLGIAVDNAGNAYVTGRATSNFLVTPGTFQTSPGGHADAFVAKVSPNDATGFSLSSFSIDFQSEGIGGTTPPKQISLANTGSATLTIASILSAGDFAETNDCGGSLSGGTKCTISVTFTPTIDGVRTGTITITDSVASSPQKITLTGNGTKGVAGTLSPASLDFGNQTQSTKSATQTVSFMNTGSATLTINGFSLIGANLASFGISTTTCQQNQSLAVGQSCTFSMVFDPQAIGTLSATLQILDNSAQSPRSVPLTGVGLAPPAVTLSAKSLSFTAQPVGGVSSGQAITLTTSGTGTLGNISISASTSDFRTSDTCGSSVAGGGSCTITVTFTPTVVGARTGTLVIVDNATDNPQMIPLSGTGTDFSISPTTGSSSSATVPAGQAATYTVSVAGTTSDFSGTVSLNCSDPAPQSTCRLSSNSLTINGTTATSATVTVTTMARSAAPSRWRPRIVAPGLRVGLPWLLLFLSLVILTRALRRRSRRRAWLGLAAMLMAAALFFGCGGANSTNVPSGTTAGTYLITVSAMSGGASRTSTLSLTVK